MSGFFGAQTDQLRAQAEACRRSSGALHDLIGTTSSLIASVEWSGPDADAFRERWAVEVRARLTERAEALQSRSEELREHAEEQDNASEGDGGTASARFGTPLPFPFPMPFPLQFPGGAGPGGSGPGEMGEPPYFYGDEGYGTGNAAGDERPVGEHQAGGSHWDGREIDEDIGYLDGYANTRASAGADVTVDDHGNTTRSAGARAGAEIGFDELLNGPFGTSIAADGRIGAEAYGEAGVTYGDGVSAGAAAGAGVYGDLSATLAGPLDASTRIGVDGYAGAEAHANAYSHATRNDDGNISGWSVGFDGGLFAGAKADADFSSVSPGGWMSASGSLGVDAGASIGGGAGAVVSTDAVGFNLGGDIALGLGLEGDIALSISPNNIVDTFTPGDYNLDDAISDASGALDTATSAVGDALSFVNPFD